MNAESTREALDVASLAGDILLASGAEIFRVEETIDRIARAYGVKSSDAFVLSSGIFLTAESGKKQEFARVRHIPLSAARLDKVTAVNQLSREIEAGCTRRKRRKRGCSTSSGCRKNLKCIRSLRPVSEAPASAFCSEAMWWTAWWRFCRALSCTFTCCICCEAECRRLQRTFPAAHSSR